MTKTEIDGEPKLDNVLASARATNDADAYDNSVGDVLDASLQKMDDEANAIMDSIREELFTPPSNKSNHDRPDDNVLTDDEMHDDFEMDDELTRLNKVVASIKEDLDAQSVASMASAISDIDGPPPRYRYSQRTIAIRVEEAEQFLRKNNLYGPGVGGEDTSIPLLVFTVAVWTMLLLLVLHVKFGALDENGNLNSLPGIVQSFGLW